MSFLQASRQNNPSAAFYRPDIDGLRAVAVLAVIGYHYFPDSIEGGFTGVDIFFVISGFLIGGILIDMLRAGRFSLLTFYGRRIRRILPALILVMIVSLSAGWFVLLPDDYLNLGKHTLGGAGFVSNIVLFGETGYFDVTAELKPLLHLWSLGIEEQFYFIFPLFLWGLWQKKLRLTIFVALLACFSYGWSVFISTEQMFNFFMPITRFWELLAGVLLALWERRPSAQEAGKISAPVRSFVSWSGVFLLIIALITTQAEDFPGSQALVPVLGTVFVIAAGDRAGWNRLLLACRPMVWIGLISYPLYLWHWPLLSYAQIIYGEFPDTGFRVAMLGITLVLATMTYWMIERPFRFGKQARTGKTILLCALLILTGCAGGAVFLKQGLPDRAGIAATVPIAAEGRSLYYHIQDADKQAFLDNYAGSNVFSRLFCLYRDVGGEETTVLIGDSHAKHAFPSIADFNAKNGVNTLLVSADGQENPFNGAIDAHIEEINAAYSLISKDERIRKVFAIARGRVYISGNDFDRKGYPLSRPAVKFQSDVQQSVDRLRGTNREVFIVSENPALPVNIKSVLPIQPFRPPQAMDRLHLTRAQVLGNQEEYLEVLRGIKGATIIPTIDAFCPEDKKECLFFNENGLPLYMDDDHLSIRAGGEFLVEKVLKPYLSASPSAARPSPTRR